MQKYCIPYFLRTRVAVRLSVCPRNTSKAVRLVYDPLMLAVDAFPTFRSLLYQRAIGAST